jgi:hypothetical protein
MVKEDAVREIPLQPLPQLGMLQSLPALAEGEVVHRVRSFNGLAGLNVAMACSS